MSPFYAALFLPALALTLLAGTPWWSYFLFLLVTFVPGYILYMWYDTIVKNQAFGQQAAVRH
jgi:hypothetical protein